MSYALQIERAPLRRYFPHADGRANPPQWFVFRSTPEARELLAGPFSTRAEAEAAARSEIESA